MGFLIVSVSLILLFASFFLTRCDGGNDYYVNATVVRNDPGASHVQGTFPGNTTIKECLQSENCSDDIIKTLQDLRLEFLSVLPKANSTLPRGLLITSPTIHEQQSMEYGHGR
ncbi:unnamed protein product [Cuscuta epithymum]|uniref:Uncharacterized protein n=1 Tax=Cuscuta epithymum TaxID=186058 RepID=A0AAV0CKG1_9ASTE|nr:unnamed protein product [Cuscuta epithymum]